MGQQGVLARLRQFQGPASLAQAAAVGLETTREGRAALAAADRDLPGLAAEIRAVPSTPAAVAVVAGPA